MGLSEQLMTRLTESVSSDSELRARGKYFNCKVLLVSGSNSSLLFFQDGNLKEVNTSPGVVDEWDFALKAPEETWSKFLQEFPPPMYHDIWAATWMGHMTLEGNIKVFMQNHYALWRTLKIMRELENA